MCMSLFSNITKKLDEIKTIEGLTDKEIELLSTPKKINYTKLEVGGKEISAWRILFNNALGAGKGGIRFHPDVSEDEVKSLSFWMMIKNSLAELPYGGAKGGVKFNPKETSIEDIQEISRKFIDAFYKDLGQDKDVPAPDVYTNAQIMSWMLDQYEKNVGHHEPAMITGKPLELQGSELRNDATAKGGFIIIKEMVKKISKDKGELKIAVQGFGNAGLYISQMLYNDGFNVVAVSDSKGGIYNVDGLNIEEVIAVKKENGSVIGYENGEEITNKDLLELDVDILVLSALENQVTEENADNIKAKYVVEIANGPVSNEADKILFNKGVMVVPDVLANAGGVIVSYFEWAQNRTGNILDNEYLEGILYKKMISSWDKMMLLYEERNKEIDLRTVAYIIALRRIITAEKLRGNL